MPTSAAVLLLPHRVVAPLMGPVNLRVDGLVLTVPKISMSVLKTKLSVPLKITQIVSTQMEPISVVVSLVMGKQMKMMNVLMSLCNKSCIFPWFCDIFMFWVVFFNWIFYDTGR